MQYYKPLTTKQSKFLRMMRDDEDIMLCIFNMRGPTSTPRKYITDILRNGEYHSVADAEVLNKYRGCYITYTNHKQNDR